MHKLAWCGVMNEQIFHGGASPYRCAQAFRRNPIDFTLLYQLFVCLFVQLVRQNPGSTIAPLAAAVAPSMAVACVRP